MLHLTQIKTNIKMNKGLLALNGVLGIAVIILFYLHFSSKSTVNNAVIGNDNSVNDGVTNGADSLIQFINTDSNILVKPAKIAYVNSDSLDKNLKMLDDVEKEIKAKEEEIKNKIISEKTRYENKYKSKMQNFDTKRKSYSASLPSMTDAQAQVGEKELIALQQELGGLDQTYSQELMIFQQTLEQEYMMLKTNKMRVYYDKVKEYCGSIAKSLGFDFILIYQDGGAILYSNSSFDISKTVVEAINKEYDSVNPLGKAK
jgi:outer membrane protein